MFDCKHGRTIESYNKFEIIYVLYIEREKLESNGTVTARRFIKIIQVYFISLWLMSL